MSPSDAALAEISDPSFDSVKLFHTSSLTWPIARSSDPLHPVHICIFDSSYNPPTRAHRAIASSSFPPRYESRAEEESERYTARLLILSARNVDKTPKEGDASLKQRLDMIKLQAKDMASAGIGKTGSDPSLANIAVGALNHPTFVGKSEIVLRWLRETHLPSLPGYNAEAIPPIRLTFLIGTDTLVRIWVSKYYTPDPKLGQDMAAHLNEFFHSDRSRIVCAHRGSGREDTEAEEEFIRGSEECRRALAQGRLRFIKRSELSPEEMAMSSTSLRNAVKAAKLKTGQDRCSGVDKLCLPAVGEYIWEAQLYRQ